MNIAVGLVELTSIARGILVADSMLKAAQVEILDAKPTCPGKYIIVMTGEVAAVTSAVETGVELGEGFVVEHFTLPNVHPDVIRAMNGGSEINDIGALGVIESFSIAALITAADAAVKAAKVELIEIRNGLGIGGKSYVTLTGDVASVQASVDVGASLINECGMLLEKTVIPSPHPQLKPALF